MYESVNFDKLDQAVTFINDHPELHDQSRWTCKTGACLAGWGALLNGYVKAPVDGIVVKAEHEAAFLLALQEDDGWHEACKKNYRWSYLFENYLFGPNDNKKYCVRSVRDVAVEVFGLHGSHVADRLFAGANTAENIKLMTKAMHDGLELREHFRCVTVCVSNDIIEGETRPAPRLATSWVPIDDVDSLPVKYSVEVRMGLSS